MELLPNTSGASSSLVRRIIKSKYNERFHESKGVSYTTIREEFRKFVSPYVEDINLYGTHSIKSGAASNPGCRKITGELLDKHAGWKCPSSKFHYIKYTKNDLLEVSKALGV